MEITLSISPSIVQPGQLITGRVQLSHAPTRDELDLSPLQRMIQARPNTPLPDLCISVRLVGTALIKQEERVIILQASPVSTIINCSFNWESRLPSANLLPSFHRGKMLRCAYFAEIRIEREEKARFRRFRIPITVRTSPGVFDLDIPSSPYSADWMRIPDMTVFDAEPEQAEVPVYIPPPPSESDSMMEGRLAELEGKLRAMIDRLGLKQPDKDWHVDDPYYDDTDDVVDNVLLMSPEEFRIDFNDQPFVVLLLTQKQFKVADVIRGKLTFEKGASDCVFVQVQLVSCENEIENGACIRQERLVWHEDRLVCADLRSDDFSLLLPYGPDACANFRTPTTEMQWQLSFQFALSKSNAPHADRNSRQVLNEIIDGGKSNEFFDLVVWELDLDVVNNYKRADDWSKGEITFFVTESDLAEFRIKR